jgi:LacI family transcriptional regulator
MVTLSNIAKRAGVTDMTVSRVLSGKYAATHPAAVKRAERIRRIAAELGYRPNAAAKATASGRFNALGLIVRSDMNFLPHQLLEGITDAAQLRDQHLSLARVGFEAIAGGVAPRLVRELCVDGLLLHESKEIPLPVLELLRHSGVPTVWINAKGEHDCVYPDEVQGARLATEALLAAGHRRIANVSFRVNWKPAEPPHFSQQERIAGYEQAMSSAGLAPRVLVRDYAPKHSKPTPRATVEGPRPGQAPVWIETPWGHEGDDRVAYLSALLREADRPTALVCNSPQNAAAVMQAAAAVGLSVPRDLSLAVTHHEEIDWFTPRLSVSQIPLYEVGRYAVRGLVDRIAQPDVPLPSVVVPYVAPLGATIAAPPLPS